MDFAFSETQQTLADLCSEVLGGADAQHAEDVRLADDPLWQVASSAGLVTVILAEDRGGSGLGMADACVVLNRCGAVGLALPIGNAMAALAALDEMGAPRILGDADHVSPDEVAVFMPLDHGGPDPSTGAPAFDIRTRRLSGGPLLAPTDARLLLVWATVDGRDAAVLIDVTASGLTQRQVHTAGARLSTYSIPTEGAAAVDFLTGEDVSAIKHRTWQRTLLLGCAELSGLAGTALKMTADYAAQRHQFNRPIGTFQGVSGRLADCYIDVEAMQWTLWRAAEGFDSRRPSDDVLAVARVLACQGSDRVLAAAQHIHGGLGVDVSYPLHRYFLRTRHLLLAAGGAERHLSELGAGLALRAGA